MKRPAKRPKARKSAPGATSLPAFGDPAGRLMPGANLADNASTRQLMDGPVGVLQLR